jgi:hypothetical protein
MGGGLVIQGVVAGFILMLNYIQSQICVHILLFTGLNPHVCE